MQWNSRGKLQKYTLLKKVFIRSFTSSDKTDLAIDKQTQFIQNRTGFRVSDLQWWPLSRLEASVSRLDNSFSRGPLSAGVEMVAVLRLQEAQQKQNRSCRASFSLSRKQHIKHTTSLNPTHNID